MLLDICSQMTLPAFKLQARIKLLGKQMGLLLSMVAPMSS
jgi:hypothetical protein